MSKPVLYIFAISHYCEKARWALDYLGVDYKLKPIAPGIHIKLAQKLGTPTTSVPILTNGDTVVQGSADIISWAEAYTGKSITPDNSGSTEIEKRLDDIAGVHIRRCYYSEALVDHDKTVKPMFLKGIPFLHQMFVRRKWSFIRNSMINRMDLGPEQHVESKNIIESELEWLDDMLADGRKFLVGDSFSRADMAMASLFAPLATPKEHPTYANLALPPLVAEAVAKWQNRPTIKHVLKLYSEYR